MDTQLNDISELIELKSYAKANSYLKLGWILLGTHLWDYGHPVERHQGTIYVLGWRNTLGEPKHPPEYLNAQ